MLARSGKGLVLNVYSEASVNNCGEVEALAQTSNFGRQNPEQILYRV
jgi:hypothetical protein